MVQNKLQPTEIARGILLLGVFHIHAMYAVLDHLGDPGAVRGAWLQIKLLAPHVVIFFALSGITSKSIADKTFVIVANRSLMLLLIAAFSHIIGILIQYALWQEWISAYRFAKDIVKPIIYGTGYATFVAWFFVVLAIIRVFAFFFTWNLRYFVALTVIATAGVAASIYLKLPDNLYEWRNWPAAFLMFLLGTRIAEGWRVPHWVGLPAVAAGLAGPVFNSPTLLTDGICIVCDPQFVAEPMVGGYGFMPLYFLGEFLFFFGLLWVSRLIAATPIAGFLVYVGRRSIKLLLLHGWVILSIYGVAAYLPPTWRGVPLFLGIFAANTLLHVLLYEILNKPLDRFILACSITSRRLIAIAEGVIRFARPLPSRPHQP
ncbi:MAG: hypothetical protein FJ189_07425 [Gammaproteobacteria bacterium]|nr:hypothetical protein [Gammaproteobacteria bacterium]